MFETGSHSYLSRTVMCAQLGVLLLHKLPLRFQLAQLLLLQCYAVCWLSAQADVCLHDMTWHGQRVYLMRHVQHRPIAAVFLSETAPLAVAGSCDLIWQSPHGCLLACLMSVSLNDKLHLNSTPQYCLQRIAPYLHGYGDALGM